MNLARKLIFFAPLGLWAVLSLRTFSALAATITDPATAFATWMLLVAAFFAGWKLHGTAIAAAVLLAPVFVSAERFQLLPVPGLVVHVFCAVLAGLLSTRIFWNTRGLERSSDFLVWDGFATWVALGAAWFIWLNGPQLIASNLPGPPWHAFSEIGFTLSNTHLWLSAWLLCRAVVFALGKLDTFGCRSFVSLVCCVWAAVLLLGWSFQNLTDFPERYLGRHAFAPAEDIHAFGAIAATVAAYSIASVDRSRAGRAFGIAALASVTIVAFSFSRGAWLALGVGILVHAVIAWSWRGRLLLAFAAVLTTIVLINFGANPKSGTHPHLQRLASFVRVDRWGQSESFRLHLYARSIRMAEEKPFFGHGIGCTRRIGAQFSTQNEPAELRVTSDFLHNLLLQLVAESGVPAGILLVSVFLLIFHRAVLCSQQRSVQSGISALLVGCVAYLTSQLTSNGLNIYPSQAVFFWPLFAALWHWSRVVGTDRVASSHPAVDRSLDLRR